VELGHNPADFALLAFGGGGGIVGVDVARELSIPTVIIPPGPGAFSAFGMLMANVQHDFSRTRMSLLESVDTTAVAQEFADMQAEGAAALETEGFAPDRRTFARFVDLRYAGQEHSVTLPVEETFDASEVTRLHDAFAEAHERAYGHTMTDPIELVAVRLSATGVVDSPTLPEVTRSSGNLAPRAERMVYRGGGARVPYQVFHRDDFGSGDVIQGPAIVNEHTATTVLHRGDVATIGALGEIVISIGKEG
jgi:N-methylhydantoinase A